MQGCVRAVENVGWASRTGGCADSRAMYRVLRVAGRRRSRPVVHAYREPRAGPRRAFKHHAPTGAPSKSFFTSVCVCVCLYIYDT